jgi:hypothetical protein
MKTKDDDRLIAEFMGVTEVSNGLIFNNQFTPEIKGNVRYGDDFAQMKFYSSWDWLMPVVEKIHETGIGGGLLYGLRDALLNANINKAYEEVVEFIQWYNKKS